MKPNSLSLLTRPLALAIAAAVTLAVLSAETVAKIAAKADDPAHIIWKSGFRSIRPAVCALVSLLVVATGLEEPDTAFAADPPAAKPGAKNSNATLELKPKKHNFGKFIVSLTSPAKTVNVTNNSTATAITFSSILAEPPFKKVSDTCGTSIPAAGTCHIGVAFHPTATGKVDNKKALTFTDSAKKRHQHVELSGIGVIGPTPTPTTKATPTRMATPKATPTPTPTLAFSNVVVVLEENHSYSQVVGSSSMPYFNSLISKYALATQDYADTHPSLPNYLWITTGSADGISSDVCGVTVSNDNIVREMAGAGVSWKSYQEDLPSVGFLGCSSGNYVEKHDPFAYFSDVQSNSVQADKIVPFTEFATDLAGGTLPRFSFITPNLQDDAHDGTLAQADTWLQTNIAPLLLKPMFQPGGSGLLIIVFDEGTDNTNGGGQVAWVAIGPKVKPGYRSVAFYLHESTLRLILKGLGVTTFPGAAATAPDMTEFFQ